MAQTVRSHNTGDPGPIPGSERSPGEGNGSVSPVFLPGESQGQMNLAGYTVHRGLKDQTQLSNLHFDFLGGFLGEHRQNTKGVPVRANRDEDKRVGQGTRLKYNSWGLVIA